MKGRNKSTLIYSFGDLHCKRSILNVHWIYSFGDFVFVSLLLYKGTDLALFLVGEDFFYLFFIFKGGIFERSYILFYI